VGREREGFLTELRRAGHLNVHEAPAEPGGGPIVYGRLQESLARLALSNRSARTIVLALTLFLTVLMLRYIDRSPDDAVLVLNIIPVAVVAFYLGWEAGLLAAGASIAAAVLWAEVRQPAPDPLGYATLAGTYLATGAVVGAFADRLRAVRRSESRLAERAAILEEEREEKARRAVALERGRLARELHDVVAHSLSIMTVQAAGARRVIDRNPARAAEAIGAIEGSGREALIELRRLLTVLRPGPAPAGLEAPPTLEDLPLLVKHLDRAGVHTDLRIEGEPHPLPVGVDLSAYRIVQEALTNVIKHVGECRAGVTVRYERDAIEVHVQDDGGSSPRKRLPQDAGLGSGLIGMNERVALLGGQFEAGPQPGGGYHVHAWLPLE
jgi:signal transduction histidine kinase